MKTIILFLSLLLSILYTKGQEINTTFNPKSPVVLAVETGTNVDVQFGLTLEFENPLFKFLDDPNVVTNKQHSVFKLFLEGATLTNGTNDIDGFGWSIQYGSKSYFNKEEYKGFYYANYLNYGRIEFDETIHLSGFLGGTTNFKGAYSYFSLFSPEIGYKFLLLDNRFTFDLHVGTAWMLEIKGKGDVDNRSFDNWVFKVGIALGYRF